MFIDEFLEYISQRALSEGINKIEIVLPTSVYNNRRHISSHCYLSLRDATIILFCRTCELSRWETWKRNYWNGRKNSVRELNDAGWTETGVRRVNHRDYFSPPAVRVTRRSSSIQNQLNISKIARSKVVSKYTSRKIARFSTTGGNVIFWKIVKVLRGPYRVLIGSCKCDVEEKRISCRGWRDIGTPGACLDVVESCDRLVRARTRCIAIQRVNRVNISPCSSNNFHYVGLPLDE